MKDYIHKCNRRPFHEEKKQYKIINIAIAKSTEDLEMISLGLDWEKKLPMGKNIFEKRIIIGTK